jgi:hypothetical protein
LAFHFGLRGGWVVFLRRILSISVWVDYGGRGLAAFHEAEESSQSHNLSKRHKLKIGKDRFPGAMPLAALF